jgi:hypothetical protein
MEHLSPYLTQYGNIELGSNEDDSLRQDCYHTISAALIMRHIARGGITFKPLYAASLKEHSPSVHW